mgnify:CR=1 FL=1
MILPEGNSKKYIKVVIGIYVLFTIVSPVITKFTGKTIEVSDVLEIDKYVEEAQKSTKIQNEIENNNQGSIMGMYISGLKDDMKAKIEGKGYIVNNIDIKTLGNEDYTIESVVIDTEKKEDNDDNKNEDVEENTIDKIETIEKVEVKIENSSEKKENKEEKKNALSNSEKNDLKDYLSGIYEVNKDNITIN